MQLNVSAKLIEVLPVVTGEGKNGPWKKQNIVLETEDQYPKKYALQFGETRLIPKF